MTTPAMGRYDDPRYAMFRGHLKRAKLRRGTTWAAIATAAGITRNSIAMIRDGRALPYLDTARAIAEFLHTPSLFSLINEIRTLTCERCDMAFLVPRGALIGRQRRRFCSVYCGGRQRQLARKGRTHREALNALESKENEVIRLRSMLRRFCAGCEPESVCVTASCEWYPETPHQCAAAGCLVHVRVLQLAKERVA